MTPLLTLHEAHKRFVLRTSPLSKLLAGKRDRTVHAVNGVTLQLYPGETLGLVGESGSGKSTLGRLAIGLLAPTSGSIRYQGQALDHPKRHRQLRRELQIIFQNPYASLNPRKTVRQILAAALAVRGLDEPSAQLREIKGLLKRVSLPERFVDAYPHQLSGGQRQRISILRALAVGPKLIVADEPVSALDVSVQAQILRLLGELKAEFGLTYLFIAHDLRVVHNVCDRIAVMYLGKIVEIGSADEIFFAAKHPYTQALISAIPQLEGRKAARERIVLPGSIPSPLNPPSGCYFHTRCPVKLAPLCEQREPRWLQLSQTHAVACHLYEQLPQGEQGERCAQGSVLPSTSNRAAKDPATP